MQVIRKIVERESIKVVSVPAEFGDTVEIIVLPVQEARGVSTDQKELMKLQEQTGFARTVLADKSEDVWNEV